MMRTINWFNEHFKEQESPLILNEQNLDLYQLYMAKKSGKPNDDFPSKSYSVINHICTGIDRTQIVQKVNHTRFALCFDPNAIQTNPQVTVSAKSTAVTLGLVQYSAKDPKKKSMIGANVVPLPANPQQTSLEPSRMISSQLMRGSVMTQNAGEDMGLGAQTVLSSQ